MMLLAVTARITQEIAPIPFLWIVPLVVYLATFIMTFSSERMYSARRGPQLFLLSCVLVFLTDLPVFHSIVCRIAAALFSFFVVSWVCHGELYKRRPAEQQLQYYYLIVATGGVLGGSLVALVAPLIFDRYVEFYVALICMGGLLFGLAARDKHPAQRRIAAIPMYCIALD